MVDIIVEGLALLLCLTYPNVGLQKPIILTTSDYNSNSSNKIILNSTFDAY